MVLVIERAPATTRRGSDLFGRFKDDDAMLSTSSLGELVRELPPKFVEISPEPCEALFELLAEHDPDELLALMLKGSLAPHDLTFAAEVAGRISDKAKAATALLRLLGHPSPIVREGVVYGLSALLPRDDIHAALQRIANEDPSPAVRTAAAEALT